MKQSEVEKLQEMLKHIVDYRFERPGEGYVPPPLALENEADRLVDKLERIICGLISELNLDRPDRFSWEPHLPEIKEIHFKGIGEAILFLESAVENLKNPSSYSSRHCTRQSFQLSDKEILRVWWGDEEPV